MTHSENSYQLGDSLCTVRFVDAVEAFAPVASGRTLRISDSAIVQALGLSTEDGWVVLPPGETAKDWQQVSTVLALALDGGLARDDVFMGVGGGVIGDMTAFAASLYMRGARLILVPTTLLAMVDAAFGGKTGINFGGYKNMIGTFYPAEELRICPDFLKTLPERDYLSGLAEVIKSAMLGDAGLWEYLVRQKDAILRRDSAALDTIVRRSLGVKARIVEADLKEKSIRAHLNLGHTFAHALEAVAGLGTWMHGEAVAWGLLKATRLSVKLGLASGAWEDEVRAMLEGYGYRLEVAEAPQALLAAMKSDKKKQGGAVRFVLQSGLQQTRLLAVPDELVLEVLAG